MDGKNVKKEDENGHRKELYINGFLFKRLDFSLASLSLISRLFLPLLLTGIRVRGSFIIGKHMKFFFYFSKIATMYHHITISLWLHFL